MNAPTGSVRAILALFVLAAIFLAIQYLPLGTWPHPVAVDDYTNVGSSIADMSTRWKRPVSANLIFFFAHYAPVSSYAFMAALAVLNAAMVLWLLARVFAVRVPLAVVVAFGLVAFSHVSAFSHAIFLGLLTNLISHFFGLVSLLALWVGWQAGHARWFAGALLAFGLGAFAKEDFLLPPLLFVALLVVQRRGTGVAPGPMRWTVAAALLVIAVGSLAWHAFDRNPFVAGLFSPETSPAPYVVDFSASGLSRSFWRLLVEFAPWSCAVAAVGWVAMFARLPERRLALLWVAAVVLALVLPYAIIPRTIVPPRVYAWLPWLVGIGAVAWAAMHMALPARRRLASSWAVLALALLVAWLQWPPRMAPVAEYVKQVGQNRAPVQTLLAHREDLVQHPVVGLVGLSESGGPWCAQDAFYVNSKLGFQAQRWLVFVPAPTRCYTQQPRSVVRKQGINIGVEDLATLCDYGDLPVLEYQPDGTGRLRRAAEFCAAGR